jgi:Terminase large subunit, T4likevirus-type, N-terminal
MSLPTLEIMRALGFEPDPWQLDVLQGNHKRLLLNCARQCGKSTAIAVVSLVEALVYPNAVILLLSPSQRQSSELLRLVVKFYERLRGPDPNRQTVHELELNTGSRVISLPCNPDTIRGYSGVRLLVIDEAARVPDDLYDTVRPMLAVSGGRLALLSTPRGKRGFFYDAWVRGGNDWKRIEVTARECPRITAEFLAEEERCKTPAVFRQEYECSFEALEGLVYPDFQRCVAYQAPLEVRNGVGRKVGGIDFGFRNPFAAVWGILDRDDVLWLTGEHYKRYQPLSYHVAHLPREVQSYADPAGAGDIAELRHAGYTVAPGVNALRTGIAAVTARMQTGRLRILPGACPNLLGEAGLYRWDDESSSETPEDRHNHALAALRYLIGRLDKLTLGKVIKGLVQKVLPEKKPRRPWLRYSNEALWTRIWPPE